ncbi:hypothetical protein D3C84_575040 [compost metagenome]
MLVLAIQTVDPADGLEQAVVAHLLVDVEVGRRRCVEAGQQLVHHDQQAHLPRLFDEALLDLFLEDFRVFVAQHLVVDGVLTQLLGQPFTGCLALDVGRRWLVAGDDGALVTHARFVE